MHYQESETVELKQEFSESIRKEIVAFANSSGGKIYISVLDDGEVIGVHSADQMIQRIANTALSGELKKQENCLMTANILSM